MSKSKILYIDDEPINLMLFEAVLDKKHEILIAEDGFAGLDIISQNKDIKIVFCDMKMPNMDGIEFITQASNILPQIPYFILSGLEINYKIQEALDNGMVRKYFKKPFNMNEISSEIEYVLSEHD